MGARRRPAGRVPRRAFAGASLGLLATAALAGCSGPFPGTFNECPAANGCADTRAPNSVGPDGPQKLYEGDDPVAAARKLDFVPAWAREDARATGARLARCDGGKVKADGAAPDEVGSCMVGNMGRGRDINAGWYSTTVEGDPIVMLTHQTGVTLRVVEVTAFDNYGGVRRGPLPEYVCTDVVGFLQAPGIPAAGSSNPGKCAPAD